MSADNEIFVFIFDSGKIENVLCEEVIFENMLIGKELVKNNTQAIISSGWILPSIRHIDIEPYILKDDYCTIDFDAINSSNPLIDYPYCWVIEDVSDDIVKEIDERLKLSFNAYIGMAHIDVSNKSIEKQFWKKMIRRFGVIKSTIINFKTDKEFICLDIANKLNYKVIHLQHEDGIDIEHCKLLQSSKIKSNSDLNIEIDKKS